MIFYRDNVYIKGELSEDHEPHLAMYVDKDNVTVICEQIYVDSLGINQYIFDQIEIPIRVMRNILEGFN